MKKIFLIFLISLTGLSLSAQELIVNEFKETTDLSARTNKRLDINGSPCALVKVELPLVGVVFDQKGQVLGNVAYQTNTYWAYMPAGSKHITISHPNYHTLDVVFANYGIPYLSPSTTYVLTVTAPAIAGQPKVNTQQYVIFNITPTDANAILELDGQQVSLTDGKGNKRLPFGTYQYAIHSTLYHSVTGSVTVNDPQNKHIVNVVLRPAFGFLSIPSVTSDYNGTEVYVNDQRVGTIPYMSDRMKSGTYSVRLSNNYFDDVRETIEIVDNQTITLQPSPTPLYGFISVPSIGNLTDASVYINGEYKGKTPYKSPKLKSGDYVVRVSKAKFNPVEQTLSIGRGETTTFSGSLSANYASISISVEKNAEIWINEEKKGAGTWNGDLEAGSYLVECKLAKHRATTKEITVIPGISQTVKMDTPAAITGTLDINCNELDADIYLDGKKIGTTPMIVSDCLIGKHALKITKEGRQYTKEVDVVEDKECFINAVLEDICIAENAITYTAKEKLRLSSEDDKTVCHTFNNGTGIIILKDKTRIWGGAFKDCSTLYSIVIPNSVKSIGEEAFMGCSSLNSITIPNSVEMIEDYAFEDCRRLTSITLPNSVTAIYGGTFRGCSNLSSITIPNSVTTIGNNAFSGCFRLTSITIPNSVTSIGDRAFYFCTHLTSITIPNSVKTIGHDAFTYCERLTSISIPNSVTFLDAFDIFDGCKSITSFTIPNSVTSIGRFAFDGCSNLTSITIPNSVTSIGDWAFRGCSNLTKIICKAKTPPSVADESFKDVKSAVLYVPAESITQYQRAKGWRRFQIKGDSEHISESRQNLSSNTTSSYNNSSTPRNSTTVTIRTSTSEFRSTKEIEAQLIKEGWTKVADSPVGKYRNILEMCVVGSNISGVHTLSIAKESSVNGQTLFYEILIDNGTVSCKGAKAVTKGNITYLSISGFCMLGNVFSTKKKMDEVILNNVWVKFKP